MRVIEDFIQAVKTECVMNQHFFNFFDIPDLIMKKSYSRRDYEDIILKLIQKVKLRYLAEKANAMPDRSLEFIAMTDDDLIPLELFDWILSQIQNKFKEKMATITDFVKSCHQTV